MFLKNKTKRKTVYLCSWRVQNRKQILIYLYISVYEWVNVRQYVKHFGGHGSVESGLYKCNPL